MEPLIRNIKDVYDPDTRRARLLTLDDNPPTCTLSYSEIPPGGNSTHHIHEWEHEVFIISGSGTLFCDGSEYPVRAGDAIFVPPNVDHYTLNNGGEGDIRRIEVNPLIAAQSGGGGNRTEPPPAAVLTSSRQAGGEREGFRSTGTGQPPVIRNLSEIDQSDGPARRVLSADDGAVNYIMAYRGLDPGSTAPKHAHPGEHLGFVIEGTCILQVDGQDYTVRQGDIALVPPHAEHEWRSNSNAKAAWLVFNPA